MWLVIVYPAATDILILSLATAAVSLTLTKSALFEPWREWIEERAHPMIGKLFRCPYCVSHWVALVLSIHSIGTGHDTLILAFAIVGLSALITGAVLRLLLWDEAELDDYREQLKTARELLKQLLTDTH